MSYEYTQTISLDSRFRDNINSSTSTDFTITLPEIIRNVKKMKLISTEIPVTEYFFSEQKENNVFSLNVYYNNNDELITENVSITIPDGIYFASDISTFILNYFNNIDTGFVYLRYLVFAINEHSGKTIIRIKTQTEIDDFNEDVETINEINYLNAQNVSYKLINTNDSFEKSALFTMGFSENQLNTVFDTSSTYEVVQFFDIYQAYCVSEKIYGIVLNKYYYIVIDELGGGSDITVYQGRDINGSIWYRTGWKALTNSSYTNNIIGKIQIKQSTFNTNIANSIDNTYNERTYFNKVNISVLDIKIVNKFGDIVDLNNSDIALALEFTICI